MTELGKSLIDEGKKEKAIEIAKKAILKGMDNETCLLYTSRCV